MEHPNCTNCVLEGNPLHEEQLEIMAMLGAARAVNSVIDDERRVAFLNYGEVVASTRRRCASRRATPPSPWTSASTPC